MIRLDPMSEKEFEEAMARSARRHAENSVRRGHWREDVALATSQREIRDRYPQGLHTPNHFFAKIVLADDGSQVGETWYVCEELGGKIRFWVNWIAIDPPYRRRGYASEALEALAREAQARGAERMGLYVFADNPGAMAVYTKLGFRVESMGMVRDLVSNPGL
jgi:RimJ/RimL family protein N-acetyltransferase